MDILVQGQKISLSICFNYKFMNLDNEGKLTQSLLTTLFSQATQIQQCAIALYRHLHQIPQIGLEEYKTSDIIRKFLAQLQGLEILAPIPEIPTAVIAVLNVPNPTQSILLRCELDALQLKQASELPYASKSGLHHACGHDGHMTIMLLAAQIIVKHKQKLNKKVTFCFQPGEEGKKGAYKLFTYYPELLQGIDHCYAIHSDNSMKVGQIQIPIGPVTALSNRFSISIKGKSAHCMAPQVGIDANYIGCSLVTYLYSLLPMTVPPLEGSTLVVYKAEGGSNIATVSDNFNIIASLRTFSTKTYEDLKQKISNLSKNWCESFGASVIIQFNELCYRPVINDEGLVKKTHQKLYNIKDFDIVDGERSFAGEDFCQFSEKKPSCYIRMGSALPGSIGRNGQSIYPLHSPFHRLDQNALLVGLKLWLAVVFT